jgi:hypothetical protein
MLVARKFKESTPKNLLAEPKLDAPNVIASSPWGFSTLPLSPLCPIRPKLPE